MTNQGNVHDSNVTEAQVAILKAVTPLILEMSKDERGTDIIGNPSLQENLRAGLALARTISEATKDKKPSLIYLKRVLLAAGARVSVYKFGKRQKSAPMFRAALRLADDTPLDIIKKFLRERWHALREEQLDEMIAKQEKFLQKQEGGEDVGLCTDGWGTFVPIKNPGGPVLVIRVCRQGGRWKKIGDSLDDEHLQRINCRLVLTNSEASNL